MVRPIRTSILLALLSALGAYSASFLVPWVVRFSMVSASIQCVLLTLVLFLSTRTYPVSVQRKAARLSGMMLRAGSILVGLSAFKLGTEFYGDELITGISEWLVILAVVHFSISWWDSRAFKYHSKRWKSRKVSFVIHLALAIALSILHFVLLTQ